MNVLLSFIFSKDGLVIFIGLILFVIVSQFNDPYNPWLNLLGRIGNLCIFIYIIWRIAGKRIVYYFSQRRKNIADTLEDLARQQRDAEHSLANLQMQLTSLTTEKEAILAESHNQAERLKTLVLADTQKEIEEIHKQAQQALETESKKIIKALRTKLANEIVNHIEMELKSRLNTNMHLRLIDNSLEKVVLH